MTIHELEKELDKAVIDFSDEIRSEYRDASKNPATEGDISELARQTFYALDSFKASIIKYLKSQ